MMRRPPLSTLLSLHDALPIFASDTPVVAGTREPGCPHRVREVVVRAHEVNGVLPRDRKSTRLNSSHLGISYAVFCLKKKKKRYTSRPAGKYVVTATPTSVTPS